MTLADRIVAEARGGPMPFERFMTLCLYDPEGGFFTGGPLRSVRGGDFLTSPEVSPWFGRMMGRFVAEELALIGRRPHVVVDVGAGSGSLLRPLAAELERLGAVEVELHAVEVAPAARAALGDGPARVHTALDGLPDRFPGVVLANELLDNLPVALATRIGDGWEERWVGWDGERLCLVAVPARPEVRTWCERHAGAVPDGGLVEVQLEAGSWVRDVLGRLAPGTLVVVDYGGTTEDLASRRAGGTLRTYRAHHLGPDPLVAPGATDITVDVDFSALVAVCRDAGAETELTTQEAFLTRLGLSDEIRRLRAEERRLAGEGDTWERLRLRAEAMEAETLLHPRGLGDFRVLVAREPAPGPRPS